MSDRTYVLSYDIGTTGVKTCLFEVEDEIKLIAAEMEGYSLTVYPDGGAEQDPDEWWSAICNTTKRLMNSTSVSTSEIAGISFCSQMQGLVLVDKDGQPVRKAMSYMDQRAKKQIKELMAYGPQIAGAYIPKLLKSLQITGAVSASVKDPVYKYKWVEENEPENFARTYKWLDVKEYIICRMTDKFVMTRDSAFGTLLYDVRKGKEGWSPEMLKMFNVKPDGASKVPVPVTSAQGYNYLVVDLPRMTGDAQPLAYAAGDRKRRYYYFIQGAQQLSPNSTRLTLTLDVWTTYINEMRFDYVLLERGHAPVAASSVADYLANPRDNSAYLLSDDVNTGGEPYVETARACKNYSAETQRACIATYADLRGDFGTVPKVPAISEPDVSGVLAPRVYSVAVGDLQPFLRKIESNAPWMKSAVLGVFFAPSDLLTQSAPFTLWDISITVLDAVQKIETFMRPGAADFGYPAQAAGPAPTSK